MRRALGTFALLMTLLGGCASVPVKPVAAVSDPAPVEPVLTGWRATASATDRARIDALPGLWKQALGQIPARLRGKVTAEGALLEPAGALTLPELSPGNYLCRLIRLGGQRGYVSFKPDFCYITDEGEKRTFTKQTGTALPGGWLFADTDMRQVFLGTNRATAAGTAPPYGDDPSRDIAAVIERVAPFRWRMVVPHGSGGDVLDIYELVPIPPKVPGAGPVVAPSA
ncbi:DUF4893 domain-containing protein [Sphingomonas panacisoli]|uniref:DUF4893 domain-containing protein n=1 Tax=Sphingomonas panacisoli TaxID=1813879 RepID=A0A5B8LGQ0_9SPHN|nr:DUF4893 domain-containing protein [Sphingomonas panacisoli]QDZ07263.1 DUF4893 domain-containing protein [Sphingomonas panacisoli]